MTGGRPGRPDIPSPDPGREMMGLVEELYPICRSITGDGVRETLRRVAEHIPLQVREVPTGTRVLDWKIPEEWNIREAWIEGPDGDRVVDFDDHTLHVVSYSRSVDREMSLEELRLHLHTLPEHPDWIPYRTSYFADDWGFCLRHRKLEALEEGRYRVHIDAELEEGALTYGECLLPGASEEEVLVSAHCCHPSLANDNLSGIAVATTLAREIEAGPGRRYSYRFVFVPATIGAIAWLAANEEGAVRRIRHGLVLAGVGDSGPPTYKRSRRESAPVDRAVEHVLRHRVEAGRVRDFTPLGYDERQYCSPGFDLPVGCLMRTPHGEYPEYHTSADEPGFLEPDSLADSLDLCRQVFDILETEGRYRNLQPQGEPQLGRRGLYRRKGGTTLPDFEAALLWVLNFSDGELSLLDIAERSGLPFAAIREAADALEDANLLLKLEASS